MSNILKVAGFDPSLSNFGIAQCSVNVDTLEVLVDDLILIKTESQKLQGVNKQSDDLRRAKEVREGMLAAVAGYQMVISEIPFFSPAAYPAANFGAGLTIGILSACPIPLVQVQPREVKIAAVGHPHACKEEMTEWGLGAYPLAPWRMRKLKGKLVPIADNEHLADAIASVKAGLNTDQFRQLLAMYRTVKAAA